MHLILVTRAIYPLHGFGGMEKHCHDWIQSLSKLDCKIDIVTMPPASSFGIFNQNVAFHFIPGKISRRVLPRITAYPSWTRKVRAYLQSFLRKNAADVIYAHGLAAAGCTGLNVPLFYHPHGMEEFKTSGLKYLAYSRFRAMSVQAAAASTAVIASDEIMTPEIQKFLKVPSSKIVMIPNSVSLNDHSKERPNVVDLYQLNGSGPFFLATGRLERNKGYHVLLNAIARTKSLPESWKLIIAGDGSELETLKKIAAKHKVSNHVIFTGAVSDSTLQALFQTAHLFIHPSLYEGSSIVTLEAMKNRLPVIATKTGGLRDKIQNGTNGWLVDPGNVQQLADVIDEALGARDHWIEMGKKSRKIVEERFSWEKTAQKFIETFAHPEYFNIAT